jgi:transketolase
MSTLVSQAQVCGVVLLREDGAALLQHRDDIPSIADPGLWTFPGGHREDQETSEQAARREFLEETRYRCGELHPLCIFPGATFGYQGDFALEFFWARYDQVSAFECCEGQELRFVSRAEAAELPMPAYTRGIWDLALALQSPTKANQESGLFRASFDFGHAKNRCTRMRRRILDISQRVPALHIAPAFSCLEIVDSIYFGLMRRQKDGQSPDTFLLSKGHGAMAQYAALEELGVLSSTDLDSYCQPHGRLGAHPDYGLPGIEASTGSLGHGLPMALGIGLAAKEAGSPSTTYVVLSDGELMEGSNWEAVLAAVNLGVSDLIVFVDWNGFVSATPIAGRHANLLPLEPKFASFGWDTCSVDGHDQRALVEAAHRKRADRPLAIVAKTVKGKGVSYMENQGIWHYRSPSPAEYRQALAELESRA